jgi:hypothetical protein
MRTPKLCVMNENVPLPWAQKLKQHCFRHRWFTFFLVNLLEFVTDFEKKIGRDFGVHMGSINEEKKLRAENSCFSPFKAYWKFRSPLYEFPRYCFYFQNCLKSNLKICCWLTYGTRSELCASFFVPWHVLCILHVINSRPVSDFTKNTRYRVPVISKVLTNSYFCIYITLLW